MKKTITGIFESRDSAEKAINQLHSGLGIPNEDISFVYRNTEGNVKEVHARNISSDTPGEGAAKGATVGGALGALAGIATVVGIIPLLGPIFVAGPIIAALGLTGALGTTAAGALTGVAAGGLIGALANLGVGKENAQRYEDYVRAGDVLVVVYAPEVIDVSKVLSEHGAIEVNVYTPAI
ncbi:MAG: hypothetical protein V4697_02635 [Patescibacteria group bacterium]